MLFPLKWLQLPTRVFLVLALAASAVACRARNEGALPDRETDADLQGFVKDFLKAAKDHQHPVSSSALERLRVIVFVDDLASAHKQYGDAGAASAAPGSEVAGTCTDAVVDDTMGAGALKWKTGERSWSEVWIASDMRPKNRDERMQLKELMFHELGHCLLGKEHAPDEPHHIMSASLSNDFGWLEAHWDGLVAELFRN